MPSDYQLDPVYSQLSATRDDLLQGYNYSAMGGQQGTASGVADMTTLIMNPTPAPPPFMPMMGYEASLYQGRIQGASSMGDAYAQEMAEVSKRRTTFDTWFGVGEAAAWAIPSLMGMPGVGMGLSLGVGMFKDQIAGIFNVNDIDPVITAKEWTQATISQQMSQMAYMSNANFGEGGRGISVNQARGVGEEMYNIMRQEGLQGMEIGRIAPYIMQSGALGEVSNLDELTDTVAKQVETIANFVKRAGASIEQAAQVTSGLSQLGVGSDSLLAASNMIISGAATANADPMAYAGAAMSFAQPYATYGSPLGTMGLMNAETAAQATLYRSGEIGTSFYRAGGEALGAGSTMASTAMNYWMSAPNSRILASMQAGGGYNASAMEAMLGGEAYPEAAMESYNNMTTDQRLAARWDSGNVLTQNASQFADAMLVRMFDKMEDNDVTSPLAQRQYLVEHYGIPRELATQYERREEFMFDPQMRVRSWESSEMGERESNRAQFTSGYDALTKSLMAGGQFLRSHALPGRDERRAFESLRDTGDYETWVADQVNSPGGRNTGVFNTSAQGLRAANENMSINIIAARFAGMSDEEKQLYMPAMISALNEVVPDDAFRKNINFSGGTTGGSGVIDDTQIVWDEANNRLMMTATTRSGYTAQYDMSQGFTGDNGTVTTTTPSGASVSRDVHVDDIQFRSGAFLSGMDRWFNEMTRTQDAMPTYIGASNMMGSAVYTAPVMMDYLNTMRTVEGTNLGIDINATARQTSALYQAADNISILGGIANTQEARTISSQYTLGTDAGFNNWIEQITPQLDKANIDTNLRPNRTAGTGQGFLNVNQGSSAQSGIDVLNDIAMAAFGKNADDSSLTATDRDRFRRLVAVRYPDLASNLDTLLASAESDMSGAYEDLRSVGDGQSQITHQELRMRGTIMNEFGLAEEQMSQVSGILMRAANDPSGSIGGAARALGITDENIITAASRISTSGGFGRGALVAMGENYASQLGVARETLTQYSGYLTAKDAQGNAITNMDQAIAQYMEGDQVDFSVRAGYEGSRVGQLLSGFTASDKLSEGTMTALIESRERSRLAGGVDGTANTTNDPPGLTVDGVSLNATGPTTINVTGVTTIAQGGTGTALSSGSGGTSGNDYSGLLPFGGGTQ